MIEKILDPLIALAFPRACSLCGDVVERLGDGPACSECWDRSIVLSHHHPACGKCGQLLHSNARFALNQCGRCGVHKYDRARSAAIYSSGIKAAVLELKNSPRVSRRARRILLDRFDNCGFQSCTAIVPVPLSRKRMLERGFNQALVLAELISRHTGVPVFPDALQRKRHFAMHRGGMDRKARNRSVSGAFGIGKRRLIEKESVLLIDDVFTTGSTVSACAGVLKRNGAKTVDVYTLARTPRTRSV